MKRYGYLYEKVIAYENIIGAMQDYDSRRPVRLRKGTDYRLAWEVRERMINDFAGIIGKPRKKVIREGGKLRELQIPSYLSCIAQLALWRVCEPYVERRLHNQTFSSRKGYGGHLAAKKCERFVHLNIEKDAKYHLYFDIKKFYKHIDHRIVMDRLSTIFKDKKILAMFRAIVDSSEEGLPIGYPFSHALANLYLVPLYFLLKSVKRVSKIYVYMDNWTIFSRHKKALHKARTLAQNWLRGVGCEMKGDWQLAPTTGRLVKVCGFRIGKGQTLLYRGNWLRTLRDFRAAYRGMVKKIASMASRRGWLRFINREYALTFKTPKGNYLWQK